MSAVLARLDAFWFAEAPAARLAVLRVLVGGYAAWLLHFRGDAIIGASLLPARQFQPVGILAFLSSPPPARLIELSLMLAMVASVAFVLGVAYRVSGPLFAGLLLWVLTYYASWGSVNHPDALVTAHVLLLGATRAADAFSLDAVLRAARGRGAATQRATGPNPEGSWHYGFAIKLICTVTALTYLLAGIAKLAGPNGLNWVTGEGLLMQMAWDGLRKDLYGNPPPGYAVLLYQHTWMFTLMAIGSMVVELGAPLAVLHRRLGYVWVLSALAMHWGIYLLMGITFRYYMWGLAFVAFLPLELMLAPFRRLSSLPASLSIGRRTAGGPRRTLPRPGAAVLGVLLITGAVLFAGSVVGAGLIAGRDSSGSAVTDVELPAADVAWAAAEMPDAAAVPAGTAARAASEPGSGSAEAFAITFVGDILVGDAAQKYLDRHGYNWPFERVRHLLSGSYAIGNLEAPITERTDDYFPWGQWDYNMQPAAARALADVGFAAVGISNNHTLDRGPDGLADTRRHLGEAGVRPFGGGMDTEEAGAPLMVPTPHGLVAILAFGDTWRTGAVAGPGQPGTVPYSEVNVLFHAEQARTAGARWLVAFVHWGENYRPIEPEQRRAAQRFARAGYDLVIGHHPHIVQPVEIVQGMAVVYSLGNFVFGTPGRFSAEAPGYGLVAKTAFGPEGLLSIEFTCILTDNDHVNFQPRPCDEAQSRELMQIMGPEVAWQDGRGVIRR